MLDPDPDTRISVVDIVNNSFFLKDYDQLKHLTFKKKQLDQLHSFWTSLRLKSEVKNFGSFMASIDQPSSIMERIFEAKAAETLKQVINGLSYITEDMTVSRYIVE
jgi:hypothetical protein